MTIYEYISLTQPYVLTKLIKAGLLIEEHGNRESDKKELTYADIIALMKHDKWKRVRGAIKQIHSGRVFL